MNPAVATPHRVSARIHRPDAQGLTRQAILFGEVDAGGLALRDGE
jgi:hypothetical protein